MRELGPRPGRQEQRDELRVRQSHRKQRVHRPQRGMQHGRIRGRGRAPGRLPLRPARPRQLPGGGGRLVRLPNQRMDRQRRAARARLGAGRRLEDLRVVGQAMARPRGIRLRHQAAHLHERVRHPRGRLDARGPGRLRLVGSRLSARVRHRPAAQPPGRRRTA